MMLIKPDLNGVSDINKILKHKNNQKEEKKAHVKINLRKRLRNYHSQIQVRRIGKCSFSTNYLVF